MSADSYNKIVMLAFIAIICFLCAWQHEKDLDRLDALKECQRRCGKP